MFPFFDGLDYGSPKSYFYYTKVLEKIQKQRAVFILSNAAWKERFLWVNSLRYASIIKVISKKDAGKRFPWKGTAMIEYTKKRVWILMIAALVVIAAAAAAFRGGWQGQDEKSGRGYVAVIRIEGTIYGGEDGDSLLDRGQGSASERVMRELREARKDPHAKAVLLRINTPGGSAAAAQEIAEEVDKLRSSGKPVVVSMGDMCASAGYWIASRGNYLFASPATMTGSIGVYIDYNNAEELMNKLGIRNEKIKSGAHKDILSWSRPMTGEERELLQKMVNDIYGQFVHVVADGRHMEEAKVRGLADGRIFTGRQALDAGLIDAVGNYYDALDYAGHAAGLGEGDIPTKSYSSGSPLMGLLSSEARRLGQAAADGAASRILQGSEPAIR